MLPWYGHKFERWISFQLLIIFPFATTGFKKSFLSSDITWVFRMRLPTLTDVVMGRQLALLMDTGSGWLKQAVTGRIVFCSSLRKKINDIENKLAFKWKINTYVKSYTKLQRHVFNTKKYQRSLKMFYYSNNKNTG